MPLCRVTTCSRPPDRARAQFAAYVLGLLDASALACPLDLMRQRLVCLCDLKEGQPEIGPTDQAQARVSAAVAR